MRAHNLPWLTRPGASTVPEVVSSVVLVGPTVRTRHRDGDPVDGELLPPRARAGTSSPWDQLPTETRRRSTQHRGSPPRADSLVRLTQLNRLDRGGTGAVTADPRSDKT